MRLALYVCLTVAMGLAGPDRAAADTIYALTAGLNPGRLYTVSSVDGTATLFQNISTFASLGDLAFLEGTLYAVNVNNSFGTISLTTGGFTPLGNQRATSWTGLASVKKDNKLYAVNYDDAQLVAVTPSGVVTTVAYGIPRMVDLTYDATHDYLFGVDNARLYKIYPGSGTYDVVGSLGQAGSTSSLGLAYNNRTNVLYLNNGETRQLYTLNPATGTPTLVGSNGVGVVLDGLAVYEAPGPAVPEPRPIPVLLGGMLVLSGLAMRRSRVR